MNETQSKHQTKIWKLSWRTVIVSYSQTLHETYAVLTICLIKVSLHACSAKGKALGTKVNTGVNRKGVRTCVTTIALCTICLTMFITFFHICMSKDFFEWIIYFMVTIPALCPNSPKLGFLKVFYRCQLTITWMSNIKEGRYKPRLYVSINLLHVAVVWPTSNSDVSCL